MQPFLFLTVTLLSSCAGLKKFPTDTLIEYDSKLVVCRQYRVVDYENFKFEYVKNIVCPSVFGFTESDVPKVLNWMSDSEKYVKEHCK